MNNFGKIEDKVPARSHAFHDFFLECLDKENKAYKDLIINKPNSSMARLYKHDCMIKYSKISKLNKDNK